MPNGPQVIVRDDGDTHEVITVEGEVRADGSLSVTIHIEVGASEAPAE